MMFIDELYQRSVADNDKNVRFFEDYVNSLKSLDFNVYADKLKVPILAPVGSRMFFRGELKHTNEVTVALGADYFVKCSLKQAEVLRQHRIKDAQSKLDIYLKEKEYLENHLSFSKENVYDEQGQDIIEHYTEEEDEAWRKKHRENVRKHKQMEAKDKQNVPKDEITDKELWERLEELELEEELETEMLENNYNELVDKRKENSFLVNEQNMLLSSFKEKQMQNNKQEENKRADENINIRESIENKANISVRDKTIDIEKVTDESKSNQDLLQKVLDKQNELENKLHELKYRERQQSKSEQDLISKLDEMDQLEELEDEIDRIDDILDNNVDSDDSEHSEPSLKRSISFADEDDSKTLEITFKHTDVEPNNDGYDPEKGITKPSDIYGVYSHLFDNKPTSILKKSKYGTTDGNESKKSTKQIKFQEPDNDLEGDDSEEVPNRTIVVNDVVEKPAESQKKVEMGARPTSLFKKKRLQNKVQFS